MADTTTPAALYEVSGHVATIAINRPDAMNTINIQMRAELQRCFNQALNDDAVRVIVLAANGRAFCAGQDLNEGSPPGDETRRMLEEQYKPLILTIDQSPKIVIAAVNGAAAGIGTAIALSCDLVMMADDAYMYQAFAPIGLVPDGGVCWQLVQQVGYRKALEIAIEAEKIPASHCMELGLANRVVAADNLRAEAQAWAERIAAKAPLAMSATKKAIKQAQSLDLGDTISAEALLQSDMTRTEDAQEAVKAFLEKRKPVFKGR